MSSYNEVVNGVHSGVDRFFKSNFGNIHIKGPKLDPEEVQKRPLMVVCTHRSHIDYILVGILLHKMGFKNMRFAAGDNLTGLPVIGPWFKSMGAFTVARDNGFERNYVRNLCNDVIKMLENKEPVIVFPEGGRSYSGATMRLKDGVLGAAILCQAKGNYDNVNLLFASISYEYPPDVPWFELLQRGKKLKKRNNNFFKRLVGRCYYFGADILAFLPMFFSAFTGKKFGDIYVDYKEPVPINSIVDIESNRAANGRDEFSVHRMSMQKAGEAIYPILNSLFCILPIHVAAALMKGHSQMSKSRLEEMVPSLVQYLVAEKRNVGVVKSVNSARVIDAGISQLLKVNAITVHNDIISIKKSSMIDYFAAAIGENWR